MLQVDPYGFPSIILKKSKSTNTRNRFSKSKIKGLKKSTNNTKSNPAKYSQKMDVYGIKVGLSLVYRATHGLQNISINLFANPCIKIDNRVTVANEILRARFE